MKNWNIKEIVMFLEPRLRMIYQPDRQATNSSHIWKTAAILKNKLLISKRIT
jgi:hypothetical protein